MEYFIEVTPTGFVCMFTDGVDNTLPVPTPFPAATLTGKRSGKLPGKLIAVSDSDSQVQFVVSQKTFHDLGCHHLPDDNYTLTIGDYTDEFSTTYGAAKYASLIVDPVTGEVTISGLLIKINGNGPYCFSASLGYCGNKNSGEIMTAEIMNEVIGCPTLEQ